jgi:uncharacterized SAM-binding protein YcdF (DUF218 family)
LVGVALMPTTLVWLLLLALLVRSWREPRWRRVHAGALLAYTAAGSPWSSYLLLSSLERSFTQIDSVDESTFYDAVAVMGGGTSLAPRETAQLNLSGDRLRVAAALFASGKTPILVTSGSTVYGERDVSAETASIWTEMGIPERAILRVPQPRNSAQEVAALAELATQHVWERVGLVTSARHMPRVLALCKRQGFEVTPLPSDFRADPPTMGLLGILPTGDGFADVGQATWEYVGIAAVRLVGG